jgi:hypothetical protein
MSTGSNIINDVWSILSFKAFMPDAGEPTLPLKSRITAPVGGLYIGPAQMTGCIIRPGRAGFTFSDIVKRPIDFSLKELHPEDFRTLFREKVGDLVVIVGGLTDVALKSNIRRQPEVGELIALSNQAQKLLGMNYAINHRYSLLHNPNHNQCFLAGTELAQLNALLDVIKRVNFRVVRLQSAFVCALDKVLDEEEVKLGRAFPLILDNGNAFFTKVGAQGTWEGWRYRAKVITSPEESALKVFINSLALNAQDNLLVVDLGSSYDYPIEKDLEGINYRRYEVASVGREYLPFYLSTFN